jgi:hypothetical protein
VWAHHRERTCQGFVEDGLFVECRHGSFFTFMTLTDEEGNDFIVEINREPDWEDDISVLNIRTIKML